MDHPPLSDLLKEGPKGLTSDPAFPSGVSGILDSITDGFQAIGADYRFQYFNEAARRTLLEQGTNPDELIGRHIFDEVFPAERDKPWAAALRRTMSERLATEVETFYEPWQRWFVTRYYPAPDGGVSVFFLDITERKRAEEALRTSEERLRKIFEYSNDAIFVLDPERDVICQANPKACEMFGYGRDEILATPISRFHPSDLAEFQKFVQGVFAEGQGWTNEFACRAKDGRFVSSEISASTIFVDGRTCILALVRDITERKQAEQQLRRSEQELAGIFNQTTAGIAQTDLTGRFTLVNERYCQMVGRPREELYRMRMQDITHPDDLPANLGLFDTLAREGTPFTTEKRYIRLDGSHLWVRNNVSALKDEHGKTVHLLAASVDITDRKRAESMLIEQTHLMEQIASGSPLDETLTELCLAVPQLNPRVRACILLADEQRKKISGSITPNLAPEFGASLQDAPINDLCIGTCGEAIYSGKSIVCADVRKDERWSKMWRELCVSCGVLAGYSTPILGADGSPLASFFLCFGEPHSPDAWELKLAEFGAHVAGIAIERHRVTEALRESRQQLADELAATQQLQVVSAELIHEDNTEALYGRILDAAKTIMRADYASLQMFYPDRGDGGELRLVSHRGFNPETAKFWEWVRPASDSTCGIALRTGKQCVARDVEQCDFMVGSADLKTYLQTGIHAVQTTPLFSRSGRLVGMISTHWKDAHRPSERDLSLFAVLARQAADLMERARAEEALRESEARFRMLADNMSQFAWMADTKGWIFWYNQRWLDYTGTTLEEMQGWGWKKVHHPDHVDRVVVRIQQSWDTGEPWEDTFPLHGRDGQYRWFLSRAYPIRDHEGRILRWFGTNTDITDQRQAEEALREAQVRLQRWTVELEQAVNIKTAELRRSQEHLRAMATELNLTEQRERKRLATELHDHLQQTLVLGKLTIGQGKRVAAALPACLDVMKKTDEIFSEALTYTRTLVSDLSPTVLRDHGLPEALQWLGAYMQKYNQTVTVTVPDDEDLKLPEDQVILLFQSVRELLINSSKHAGTGQATVRLEQSDGRLQITVRDEGAGFDLAAAAAAAGTPSGGISSKFGLFSIRERMRALGGSFEIDSAPGKGTMATLTLPVARSAETKVLSAELSERGGKQGTQDSEHPTTSALRTQHSALHEKPRIRVLLVDDHIMVRQGLKSVLESYADVELIGEAGNGEEAVRLVERLRPAVVVMDINMPKMDGIEATEQITYRYPETIVIGLSVNAAREKEEAMKRAGAVRLMTKEAAVEELYDAIQGAVRSGAVDS